MRINYDVNHYSINSIILYSILVEKLINQKHLGLKLDERRNFRTLLKANFLLLIKELGC